MSQSGPAKAALYAPWATGARPSWGWAAILLVLAFYLAATILYVLGQLVWIGASQGADVFTDPEALTAALGALPPAGVLFALLLLLFGGWGGLTLAWTGMFERRGLASIGLGHEKARARFLGGLAWAAAIIVALALAVGLIGLLFPVEITEDKAGADWSRLADPAIWLVFAGIAAFFVFQGGIEEVVFRGWLMSTLAARWGRTAGVIATTLAFTAFHVHVFLSGFANGLAALTGIFMTGLFLAVFALRQGSIWGVVGLHGGFNALTLLGPVAYALARQPETPVGEVIASVFEQATGMTGGAAFQPQALAQALVFGVLAVLFLVWRGRR